MRRLEHELLTMPDRLLRPLSERHAIIVSRQRDFVVFPLVLFQRPDLPGDLGSCRSQLALNLKPSSADLAIAHIYESSSAFRSVQPMHARLTGTPLLDCGEEVDVPDGAPSVLKAQFSACTLADVLAVLTGEHVPPPPALIENQALHNISLEVHTARVAFTRSLAQSLGGSFKRPFRLEHTPLYTSTATALMRALITGLEQVHATTALRALHPLNIAFFPSNWDEPATAQIRIAAFLPPCFLKTSPVSTFLDQKVLSAFRQEDLVGPVQAHTRTLWQHVDMYALAEVAKVLLLDTQPEEDQPLLQRASSVPSLITALQGVSGHPEPLRKVLELPLFLSSVQLIHSITTVNEYLRSSGMPVPQREAEFDRFIRGDPYNWQFVTLTAALQQPENARFTTSVNTIPKNTPSNLVRIVRNHNAHNPQTEAGASELVNFFVQCGGNVMAVHDFAVRVAGTA
jgi:hypothetical protein